MFKKDDPVYHTANPGRVGWEVSSFGSKLHSVVLGLLEDLNTEPGGKGSPPYLISQTHVSVRMQLMPF